MKRLVTLAALAGATAALVLPSSAAAHHSWNGFHWARTSGTRALTISNGVSGDWAAVFGDVRSRWNAALGGRLSMTLATGTTNITTASGIYGPTGWLGEATVSVQNKHIISASVRLNDTYFIADAGINNATAKQQVFCQEVGHTVGLDHRHGMSCMNDTNSLANSPFPYPDHEDGVQLAHIYNHVDAALRSSTPPKVFTIRIPAPRG